MYKILQPYFGFENHFNILPVKLRKALTKFRTSNYRLPVETGRGCGTPLNKILCFLCNKRLTGDEFHYIFIR